MTHYLTNIEKSLEVARRVQIAAQMSGQNVTYVEGPMPDDADSMDGSSFYARHRYTMVGTHDCIAGHEEVRDYSAFWDVYDRLEAADLAGIAAPGLAVIATQRCTYPSCECGDGIHVCPEATTGDDDASLSPHDGGTAT
jgi:hypothetical protein